MTVKKEEKSLKFPAVEVIKGLGSEAFRYSVKDIDAWREACLKLDEEDINRLLEEYMEQIVGTFDFKAFMLWVIQHKLLGEVCRFGAM